MTRSLKNTFQQQSEGPMTARDGAAPNEGWTFLHNSRRDHYFVDGRSLCGKYAYFGPIDNKTNGNPECADCLKRLKKREGAK